MTASSTHREPELNEIGVAAICGDVALLWLLLEVSVRLIHEASSLFGGTAAAFVLLASSARADTVSLSYDAVVTHVRQQSPAVLLAAVELEQDQASVVGAGVWSQQNPSLNVRAGPRFGVDQIRPGADVDLNVPLEVYGQRGLRQDEARHGVTEGEAAVKDALRLATAEALDAWLEVLHATDVVERSEEQAQLTTALSEAVRRRREAGDVSDIDLGLVVVEDARARRALLVARTELQQVTAKLKMLLGLNGGDELRIVEDLTTAVQRYRTDVFERAEMRADLQARTSAVEGAMVAVALQEREAWPALALVAGYERDDDEHVALFGASIPLPLFQRNQGGIATASANLHLREAELSLSRQRTENETASAKARLRAAREGVAILGTDVLPQLEQNIALMRRAFEAGERGVADVLLVQRSALEARHDIHDALLELGLAGVAVDSAVGLFR